MNKSLLSFLYVVALVSQTVLGGGPATSTSSNTANAIGTGNTAAINSATNAQSGLLGGPATAISDNTANAIGVGNTAAINSLTNAQSGFLGGPATAISKNVANAIGVGNTAAINSATNAISGPLGGPAVAISNNAANAIGVGNTALINSATNAISNPFAPIVIAPVGAVCGGLVGCPAGRVCVLGQCIPLTPILTVPATAFACGGLTGGTCPATQPFCNLSTCLCSATVPPAPTICSTDNECVAGQTFCVRLTANSPLGTCEALRCLRRF